MKIKKTVFVLLLLTASVCAETNGTITVGDTNTTPGDPSVISGGKIRLATSI